MRCFDEGIFVKFGPKNSRAELVGAFPSHQRSNWTEGGGLQIFTTFLGAIEAI
jgi:hypothetical protein